ncbi:MAG: N-sulfoglucosamine sulfohydrolase [Kiritimatiellia bacterium]|jgi:N-sulfoglucosamine sulfohydrolase
MEIVKNLILALTLYLGSAFAKAPANILLITADDLGYEAIDFLGGKIPNVTPHLSQFAKESMSFELGHVNIAICAPSRSVIATGRYGFNSGCFGFNKLPEKIPTVFGTFKGNGFLTGVLGKVSHSTCDVNFTWDFARDQGELGNGRSPTKYHDYAAAFFARCKKENKPFYFMVNSHDPHRPFHDPKKPVRDCEEPTRIFSPEEMVIPSYLTDLPETRLEYAHYFNSVRRLDDTVGRVLAALDASGFADNTLVVFITDNGSAFPFAKANAYLASTHTPMLMRWPGVTKAGAKDNTHFVGNVDFFATFMEVAGLPVPDGLDGRSVVPLLKGGTQAGREYMFTQIDYTISGPAKPMRCIQDQRFGYIFNAFSDGTFAYKNNNEGLTFKAMEKAGKADPAIQQRVDMFRHRVVEEFYDLEKDPESTHNLIGNPEYAEVIARYQKRLREWMVESGDHNIAAFDVRHDPVKLAAAVKNYPAMINLEKSDKRKKTSAKVSDAKRKARQGKDKVAK